MDHHNPGLTTTTYGENDVSATEQLSDIGIIDRDYEPTKTKTQRPDPTPEVIADRCAAIRMGWSPEEEQRRLRCDWRTTGRIEAMTVSVTTAREDHADE